MKVIHKKISLSSLRSRLPGIVPSLVDFWKIPSLYSCGNVVGEEKFYSYSEAVKRASEYNINVSRLEHGVEFIKFDYDNSIYFPNGNYGLIPSDIIIPNDIASNITDYTDIYVNIPNENGGFYDLFDESSEYHYDGRKIVHNGTEQKIITYATLNKWYSFFVEYYRIIKNVDGKKSYNSAIEYYDNEVKIRNSEQESYYSELDNKFNAFGGEITYNWIINNCILQYSVPGDFVDEWKKTILFYSEAVKWYRWFKEMYERYGELNIIGDCKDIENCEDCVEYIRLGGSIFYNDLKNWIDNIPSNNIATNSASITIPISLTNSIDDFGEMTIFSNEWEEDVDYHAISGSPGTVIHHPYSTDSNGDKTELNETFIIKDSTTKGYEYNSFYENVFKNNDWLNYTDYYISNNASEFNTEGVTSYTISPLNGKVIYNPSASDVLEKIKFNRRKNVCINGDTYDVINGKYVEMCYDSSIVADIRYRNNNKLPIFKDGSLEYAIFNGKRRYVEISERGERIYFLKEANCHDNGCPVHSGNYIIYNDMLYLVNNNNIVMEEDEEKRVYPQLDGYFNVGSTTFYILGDSVVIQDASEYDEETNTYNFTFRNPDKDDYYSIGISNIIVNGDYVNIYYIFNAINCNIISGHCDSKLDLLRRKEISTDDLGNELPGYFRSIVNITGGRDQSHYNVTYDECMLDILYKVGEVSELKRFNEHYIGNIITNIEFYYKDKYGNKAFASNANNDDALSIINSCEQTYMNSSDDTIPNVMYCDITYYLGAEITKNGSKYDILNNCHNGVKYVDTVYVSKRVGTFYTNDDEYFTFKYYLLSQNVNTVDLTDFNDRVKSDASTYFEMIPMIYDNGHIINESLFKNSKFENNNGVVAAPVFRTEFNLASSIPQNVDADIYIDRGISASYEKHLKLQEIRSVEAIENMGNGFFKINKA